MQWLLPMRLGLSRARSLSALDKGFASKVMWPINSLRKSGRLWLAAESFGFFWPDENDDYEDYYDDYRYCWV